MKQASLVERFAARLDLHQSPFHAQVMRQLGWQIEGKPGCQLFYRTLGPLKVAKFQRPAQVDPDLVKSMRQKIHPLTTYVEPPLNHSYPTGISTEPFAHSASSLIDLTLSPTQLLKTFNQKTRYNITHSLKKSQLKITSTPLTQLTQDQKNDFFALHTEWSKRKNVIGYSHELLTAILTSFDQTTTLHLAYGPSQTVLGSLLTLTNDQVTTYYAAFTTTLGYRLYAPTLLTWTALQSAQSQGVDIFDFGGIYDSRYPKMYKKWHGFTQFKAGFRATEIIYPKTKLLLFW